MQYDIEKIPKELHHLKQWVGWKKGIRQDNEKITKLPINAMTGGSAKTNDPNTWTDMMGAIVGVDRYKLDGIGFVLSDNYFGVDLDDCSEDLKREFIDQLQSYTEISQSGNGIHIICKGVIPKSARTKGVEIYQGSRYFVMTGNAIGNYEIEDCSEKIKPLYDKYIYEKRKPKQEIVQPMHQPIFLDDKDLFIKARNSRNGQHFSLLFDGVWEGQYESQSEADLAFANLLAFWSNKNIEQMDRIFRMSGLYRDKWDRKQSGSTYGLLTLQKAIDQSTTTYSKAYEDEANVVVNAKTGMVYIKKQDQYELDDTGNAKRFIDRIGDFVKYNFENNKWVIWNEKYWQVDIKNQIKRYAEMIVEEMRIEASQETNEGLRKEMIRNVKKASNSSGKKALLEEAQHLENIPTVNNDYDQDDFYLNTMSGVVDLNSGEIIDHNKDLLMSKIIPYKVVFDQKPTKWLNFLDDIFLKDQEMIDFIQKAIGYTLTGSIREQSMFLAFGEGNNGKSVFLDVLSRMMSDYGMTAQVESLLERKGGSSNHTADLARLKGARFVTTGENNQGTKINEGLVKQLTGGEKITARFLYGQEFEFYPNFKIWLATNHKPIIRGNDKGIWRRIIAIPFTYQVPSHKINRDLIYELQQEIPMILAWAIEGCLKYKKEGLKIPKVIQEANKDYRKEMDIIQTFLDENVDYVDNALCGAKELYVEYDQWSQVNKEYQMSSTIFGRELGKRFNKIRKASGWYYEGIRLKKDNPDPTYVYEKQ